MEKFQTYKLIPEFEQNEPNHVKAIFKPLEKGFGITLGNALRRVCLSSVPGAAMFAIKIPNVSHEFQAIDGIYEDVTQIILNLKQLVVKIDSNVYDDEYFETLKIEDWPTLKINAKGPKVITAGDIICPTGFEIINKDLYICEITNKSNFELEIFVDKGRGFRSWKQNQNQIQTLSIIATDSNFSPILNFNFEVNDIKMSKYDTNDELIIDLVTNGAITASDALIMSAKILFDHLNPILNLNETIKEMIIMKDKAEDNSKRSIFTPIEELELTVRAYNSLKASGINTLNDIMERSKHEIEKIRNLGRKSVNEIIGKIHERGLKLRDEK